MKKPLVQIGMGPVSLDAISIDGGTQMRAELDESVVAEYAQTIGDGGDFPAVVVFFDGSKCWLGDGFHRFHAYRKARAVEIPADVREGTKRDAILHAVGANASHGLRRTNADKRKAVETLLADKEWAGWSDREISRRAGVSDRFVNGLRQEAPSANGSQMAGTRTVSRGGQTYQQNTANIGKARPAEDTGEPDRAPTVGDPEARTAPAASNQAVQDAADHAEQEAARRARQAENDRLREETRAALPEHIRQGEAARDAAISARRAEKAEAGDHDGLAVDQRTIELEEAVRSLEAENNALKAENALYEPMKAQFEAGGFAKVIAGKDEEIRVLKLQVEAESEEKVKYLRSSRYWMGEAKKGGWVDTNTVTIGTKTGEIRHG